MDSCIKNKNKCAKNYQNLKRDFYLQKLRKNVGKPKKLWRTLKSLGLLCKITPLSQYSLKNGGKYNDEKANSTSFNNFYA